MIRLFIFLIFILASPSVYAEEFTYSPDDCGFEITLPDEPYSGRRCHPDFADRCNPRTVFTQVFGLMTSLNVYVACSALPESVYENYTADIMRTSLLAMAGSSLETYQSDFQEIGDGQARMAILIGAGQTKITNKSLLYTSQIWASPKGQLIVEGEITGESNAKADKMLSDILNSIKLIID